MFLKDSQNISISRGISHSFAGKDELLDFNNCVVKEVRRDDHNANSLIVRMVGEAGLEGSVWIRSKNEEGKLLLDKILKSPKILGITLNNLFYLDLEKGFK